MDDFMSIREVAKRVGMSYMTILKFVQQGSIKAVKIGGRWRVSLTEYNRFTEGHFDLLIDLEEEKDVQ